jgi:hypothetical protein
VWHAAVGQQELNNPRSLSKIAKNLLLRGQALNYRGPHDKAADVEVTSGLAKAQSSVLLHEQVGHQFVGFFVSKLTSFSAIRTV